MSRHVVQCSIRIAPGSPSGNRALRRNIGSYKLAAACHRGCGPFPKRRPPALGTQIRGPSSTLPPGETYWTWMTNGSPAGIMLVSSRSNRCEKESY